ncbi:MAG: zinc ribbon domain-containing protein [Deltaproteobacteria bacterium]|nr:zinc ribbon domain-containing protein [Deltaproteobacteria bacterium]
MPIYEYKCEQCENEFEELVFSSTKEVQCPKCQSDKVHRLLSVTAIKTSSGFVSSKSGGSCGSCSGGSCSSCH